MTLLWQALTTASSLSSTDGQSTVTHDERCGKEYDYKDVFYMGEINPSGNCFAVEERGNLCTLLHLLNKDDGKSIKVTPLSSLSGKQEVHTLMMSSLHNGRYALMIEGGYVAMVAAEELNIVNIINVVS